MCHQPPHFAKLMRTRLMALEIRALARTAVVRDGQLQLTLNVASKVPRTPAGTPMSSRSCRR